MCHPAPVRPDTWDPGRGVHVLLQRVVVRLILLAGAALAGLSLLQLAMTTQPLAMGLISLGLGGLILLFGSFLRRARPSVALLDRTWAALMLTWAGALVLRAHLDTDQLPPFLFLPLLLMAGAFIRSWRLSLALRVLLLGALAWTWRLPHPHWQRPSTLGLNVALFTLIGLWLQHMVHVLLDHIGDRMRRLSSARREIQALQDLVPICMHCKKVRNDHGYWEQVEAYFGRRHRTDFTHGLCPGCLEDMRAEIRSEA